MASNKSNIFIIMLILSVSFKTISAPSNYGDDYDDDDDEGTSYPADLNTNLNFFPEYDQSLFPQPNWNINYDIKEIVPGSAAEECLNEIGKQCMLGNVSAMGCAQQGVLTWPSGANIQILVLEYFSRFRPHLIAGEFQLTSEFCLRQLYDQYEFEKMGVSFQDFQGSLFNPDIWHKQTFDTINSRLDLCYKSLKYFGPNEGSSANYRSMGLHNLTQKMRQDILLYAFYGAKLGQGQIKGYKRKYLEHISLHFGVASQMQSPKSFCLQLSEHIANRQLQQPQQQNEEIQQLIIHQQQQNEELQQLIEIQQHYEERQRQIPQHRRRRN